jgi:hypothetical protein
MKTTTSALGLVATGLLALAGAAPAGAGEPARSMAALEESVQPGTEVDVVDRQGRMVRGEFVRADGEGILVTLYGSAEGRRVPAGDVMNVTRAGDSMKNGALIGAGVGAFSTLLVFADDSSGAADPLCTTTRCKVSTGVMMTAMYAGIGALIDRAIKGRTVVYRAPSDRLSWSVTPHPVPRGAGVQVALKF